LLTLRHFAERAAQPLSLRCLFSMVFRWRAACIVSLQQDATKKESDNDPFRNAPPSDNNLNTRAVRRRLTDFGPGRSKLFGNSADAYLKVHSLGDTEADVTEGSGGIWERLRYDWSDLNHVVLTTTDSNLWGGASGHTYIFKRNPNGTTDIEVTVVREGKNFKGRLLGLVLRTIGRSVLEKAFVNSVKAIEARNVSCHHPSSEEKIYV
jgi:hypothetical protein